MRSPILLALKRLRAERRKADRNGYVEFLTVRAGDLRAILDAYPRCGECDACQEFLLTPDQAPSCPRTKKLPPPETESSDEERPRRRAAKTVDLKLSPTQIAILRRAARRSTGHVCPTRLRGAAEEVCLDALEKRGMITRTDPTDGALAPTITEAGRNAVRIPGEDL